MEFSWYREIAEQISYLNDHRFPAIFDSGLKRILPYDLVMMVLFHQTDKPVIVFHDFPAGEPQQALNTYIHKTFVLDPFYQSCNSGIEPGVYLMVDLAPDSFFDGEFYKQHNVALSGFEESGFLTPGWPNRLNELGLFIDLDDGSYLVISLFRHQSSTVFSARESQRLKDLFPVVSAAFTHFYIHVLKGMLVPEGKNHTNVDPVNQAFATFGMPKLSERESQIMQLVLRGHSSESIGNQLHISPMTVKTHRRNCYAKLGISSQAELLSLFLDSLADRL